MLTLLAEQFERARSVLRPDTFGYYAGGADDEIALHEQEAAWQRYRLRPRVLRDVSAVSTEVSLLDRTLAHPLLVGPTAFQGWAHPDGEVATAHGAGDATMVVSFRATSLLEDIAAARGDRPWWQQVYVTRDRMLTEVLVRRAVAAGAGALVLTGDTPFVGRKGPHGRVMSLADPAARVNFAGRADGLAAAALDQDPSVDLDAVGWLAQLSGLPVLVKGVLRGDDARACLDAGAAGLVVSNHGGRQLGRAVASADVLAEVVAAAAGAPVLVDGGVRSGADVAIALALGARAVLLGKPVLWALTSAGSDGVAALLSALVDDFAHTLALLGVRAPTELDGSFVAHC